MTTWLQQLFAGQGWIIQIFLIILITAVLYYVETFFYRRLKKQFKKTKTYWDIALLEAIHKPLQLLIWILGIGFALDILRLAENGAAIYTLVPKVRTVAIIAAFVWFLIRLTKQAENVFLKPRKDKRVVDKTTVNAVSQILRAAILVTAVLVTMQTFGYSISGILALGSVSTIIIGLAAKDLLANFFGGLMIYFDRPFNVGDWIRSPDRQIEGTVENIGWRLCRIRTFDKRPLYVPNSLFSTISVENPSRMENRRIRTNIGIRYDDAPKLKTILQDVEKMLRNHPEIDTDCTLMVNLVEFGPSSLNFMIYTFTKTTNWVKFQAIQQDVFLKIIDIITAHGAQCAFPTTTLHVPEGVVLKNHDISVSQGEAV